MGFSKMMELLNIKNKGKIVLVNAGAFYIARGKDAILLNKELNLKLSCMETEVCKVGVPIKSIEKYLEKIEEKKYGYIVYYFNQEKSELEILKEYEGKLNKTTENRANCYICKNTVKMYKKSDKYIEAISKLYQNEKEENKQEKKGIKKWKKKKSK